MGRKDYITDVAIVESQTNHGITSIAKGSEDGELHLCFAPSSGLPIEISLISLEVGGYPSENMYLITTTSMELPDGVNDVLLEIQESSAGMRVQDLVAAISRKLQKQLAAGSRDDPVDLGSDMDIDEENEDEDESDAFPESDDDWVRDHMAGTRAAERLKLNAQDTLKINRRIRADLRAVKAEGFKIGILEGAKADSVSSTISISVKVNKLGLSEEAFQAWDLELQDYIVLLIRYKDGYKSFDEIVKMPAKSAEIEFRIGISHKYKPTLSEALAALNDSNKKSATGNFTGPQGSEEKSDAGFSSLFISSSLNEFINSSFISLVKIRSNLNSGWAAAKSWFNENQSRIDDKVASISLCDDKDSIIQDSLPDLISKDHLSDPDTRQVSLPLVAIQFALRYLVRCTEYCLVCHDQIEEEFEALKPYVCNKPLCLYQYMSLGFGPSVEHEIMTQPYVIDLLVSFCYASSVNRRLREYPTGMSLMVPPVTKHVGTVYSEPYNYLPSTQDVPVEPSTILDVKFDYNRQMVTFDEGNYGKCPVRVGDWVVITATDRATEHYRVDEIAFYPTVGLSKHAVESKSDAFTTAAVPTPAITPPPPTMLSVKMVIYNQNFDDMDDSSKAETITVLVESLPSITEMKAFLLQQSRTAEPNLRAWNERISPAALGILRWIVASNRSCIVQVDKCPGQDDLEVSAAKIRIDQRMSNISNDYVQFRFAQGAPDKEQRFLKALKEQQSKFDPAHPTIFAWHGSPLQNWHSIIRSGLDFKETLHGRAYGHGVYHAREQSVSMSYAQAGTSVWPKSELKILSAMSLNEIVNCPSEFTSFSPYLVVQHTDWIQCRYLLVKVQGGSDKTWTSNQNSYRSGISRKDDVEQDPKYTVRSTRGEPIGIPLCAITTSNGFRANGPKSDKPNHPKKKRKQSRSTNSTSKSIVVDSDSDEVEDLTFLLSDDDELPGNSKSEVHLGNFSESLTDFVPGSLDQLSLPMLDEPAYATPMATRTLQRNLKEVLDIQNKTPLHELGWYIDANLVSNMYQWIVELHSFDPTTPLAQDMKTAGITSVVLEIRFGKDYPHSPPFVRVIRPRFLPFMSGGGGHVTGGGAMCMELLTNSGWSAVSSIESVLLQVRMAMMNLEPRPARLESKSKQQQHDYGVFEAVDAYRRACAQHGWQVPPDFGDFAINGDSSSSSHF